MAEPNPGQIITPNNGPDSSKQSQNQQEVSISVPHTSEQSTPQPTTPQPVVNPTPPSAPPEPSLNQPPAPQPTTIQVPAPEAAEPSHSRQSQTNTSEQPIGGFAPQFQLDNTPGSSQYESDNDESISWTASEYIAHQKSLSWFIALAVATVGISVAVYFITGGDILSVIVIVLAAIVFGIYAAKKPKEQHYSISNVGVTIGAKTYSFDQLKTFSIVEEGAFSSIMFLPMKRFMPPISIYYDPQDEEKIINVLSKYLPMDVQQRDMIDSFMRKIRF